MSKSSKKWTEQMERNDVFAHGEFFFDLTPQDESVEAFLYKSPPQKRCEPKGEADNFVFLPTCPHLFAKDPQICNPIFLESDPLTQHKSFKVIEGGYSNVIPLKNPMENTLRYEA